MYFYMVDDEKGVHSILDKFIEDDDLGGFIEAGGGVFF